MKIDNRNARPELFMVMTSCSTAILVAFRVPLKPAPRARGLADAAGSAHAGPGARRRANPKITIT
jgi:hypothetical protein